MQMLTRPCTHAYSSKHGWVYNPKQITHTGMTPLIDLGGKVLYILIKPFSFYLLSHLAYLTKSSHNSNKSGFILFVMQLRSILAILPCALLAIAVPIAAPQVGSASTSSPTGIPGDFPTGLIGGPGGGDPGGFPTILPGGPGGDLSGSFPTATPGGFPTILPGGPGGDLSGSFPTSPPGGPGGDLSESFPTGPPGGPGGDLSGSFPISPPGGPGGGSPGDLPTGLPALGGNAKRDFTETLDKRQQSLSSPFAHQPS